MRILILGGGGLTGPHQVRYALQRGHEVTLFNRGRTALPEDLRGVEQLHGDRASGDLQSLRGRQWDLCIDNPTSLPAWARDATELLQGQVGHYIFISTISVYADMRQPVSETSPVARYDGADAYVETIDTIRASGFELYGPLKALCEREVQQRFGDASTIIRPGLIVGPGDATDRFTYWPLRVRRGGQVLAPGTPADPVQFIDARDLAEWTIRVGEQRASGVFNATGPATPLPIGKMLDEMRGAIQSDATFTWVPTDFLEKNKVAPWSDMPAWVPADGELAGMMRANIDRALAKGLTFRPLAQTVRDTLAWFDQLPPDRRASPRAGLAPDRERKVLDEWHPPTLTGRACRLRALEEADAASLQRHADDEAVWETLFEGFPRPYTVADAQAWCSGGWRSRTQGEIVWGIDVDGEVIGCISVRPDSGWLRCNAEVGYWIGQAHWGHGIAADALQLVASWAFDNFGELTRIYAPIFDWNTRSQSVARKAGFQLEGAMPQSAIKAGRVIGRVVYARYRTEER
jgi:2'-hydroxyisoflavone reductase